MARSNPMEEMVKDFADVYVDMVYSLLAEIAPAKPWWTVSLKPAQKLARWLESRDAIIGWLVEAGVYMGYETYGELLENLEEFWFSMKPIDLVPVEVNMRVPIELVELVKAAPKDAAKHIRDVERLYHRRLEAQKTFEAPTEVPQLAPPLPEEPAAG